MNWNPRNSSTERQTGRLLYLLGFFQIRPERVTEFDTQEPELEHVMLKDTLEPYCSIY